MIIYLAVNRRTGLKYVGATKATLWKRQVEHRSKANRGKATKLHVAIREYGWGTFNWHVLSECGSTEEMLSEERRWIAAFDTLNPALGYNMTKGGCGVIGYEFTVEARKKIAVGVTGRIKTEEERRKLSIANKGKKPAQATLDARRARKMTDEERRRISAVNKGRKHIWSADQSAKYYEGQKRQLQKDNGGKIPHSHLPQIRARREAGESFASIGKTYSAHASTLFTWLERRAAL